MWKQTQLARRTANLCRINLQTLSSTSSSSSRVLVDFPHQIVFPHSRQLSSHLPKWGFRKFKSFQQLRPFSADSVVEPDLDSNSNLDENPDVVSSEFVGGNEGGEGVVDAEGDYAERRDLVGGNEGGIEEDGIGEEEEMGENDVEKVESLLSLLQSSGGNVEEEFVDRLNEMGLFLSEDFVVSVLGTPHVPARNFVAFYGWCLGRKRFYATKKAIDMLIRVVSGELDKFSAFMLWDLLKEFRKDGALSTEIVNELISLFSRIHEGEAAYEVFNQFEEFGCVPDAGTFYYTIQALFKSSLFDLASSVSQKMVTMEMLPDAEKIGKLICYLVHAKQIRDAHSVYLLAKEKNKCPPRSSLDALIISLCSLPWKDTATRHDTDKLYRENIYLALEILDNFSDEDRKAADFQPFSSVCQALCKIGDVDKAKGLLFSMIKSGPPPGSAVFNATINGLSKAGELEEAKNLLKVIEERGLKPDAYAYAVIISGYADGGAMVEAHQVLEEAKQRHAKLTRDIYQTMLRGYCRLDQFDEAVQLLAEMKDYGVQPTAREYGELIQSLCVNVLDWEMAERLLEEMNEKGLRLNEPTESLIRAVKELEEEEKETQEVGI